MNKYLVIDDDLSFRNRLVRSLENRGLLADEAENSQEALSKLTHALQEKCPFSHLILDLRLGAENGMTLIQQILTIDSSLKILILTGYASIPTALQAIQLGAIHYLAKPATLEQILNAFNGITTPEAPPELAPLTLADVEWEHIQRVLSDCQGNITKAAELLGMHRRSLQRKLEKQRTYSS